MRLILFIWPLLGAALVIALADSRAPLGMVAGAHVLCALSLGWMHRRAYPHRPLMAKRAAAMALCLPVAGAFLAWLSFRPDDRRGAQALESLFIEMGQSFVEPAAPAPPPPVRAPWALGAQLSETDLDGKLGAIASLGQLPPCAGTTVLREGLVSRQALTRLVATIELVRREDQLSRRLKSARARVSQRPEDPNAWLERMELACRYAESGIPTGVTADTLWMEAFEGARQALLIGTTRPEEAHAGMARALWAMDNPQQALASANHALELAPEHLEAALIRCKALYALQDFPRLAEASQTLLKLSAPESELHEVASFWLESLAAHARKRTADGATVSGEEPVYEIYSRSIDS